MKKPKPLRDGSWWIRTDTGELRMQVAGQSVVLAYVEEQPDGTWLVLPKAETA